MKVNVLISLLLMVLAGRVLAEPPKLEILGGLSSPAPGITGSAGACWELWHLGCVGASYVGSRNEITRDNLTVNASYFMGTVEHGFALSDEYHLIWLSGAAGVGYYRRKVSDASSPEADSWAKTAASVGGGFGIELPVADLMGVRVGVISRKALIAGAATQVALVAGMRFGSEWLGLGE